MPDAIIISDVNNIAWHYDYSLPVPQGLFAAFTLVVVVWLGFSYARMTDLRPLYRFGLLSLRLLALCSTLVIFSRLTILRDLMGPPVLAIVVDNSLSMSLPQESEKTSFSRFDAVKRWLTADNSLTLAKIGKKYELQYYLASDTLRSLSMTREDQFSQALGTIHAQGKLSRLGDAISDVLRTTKHLKGLLFISDGVVNAGAELRDTIGLANHLDVQIHSVTMGSRTPIADIALTQLITDDVVFLGDSVSVDVRSRSEAITGEYSIRLHYEGDTSELAESVVQPNDDASMQQTTLSFRPMAPGTYNLVAEVPLNRNEINTENNRLTRTLQVKETLVRVLLIDSRPRYEFRYLKTALERHRGIELSTFLQDADSQYVETDRSALRALPVTKKGLEPYDVIILGDVSPEFLSRTTMQAMVSLVEYSGKSMVFIAGTRFNPVAYLDTPLAKLLPLVPSMTGLSGSIGDLTPQLTRLGQTTPWLKLSDPWSGTALSWNSLPPLRWHANIQYARPGALVLLEQPSTSTSNQESFPLVAIQYIGSGNVLMHAIDESWRWRFAGRDALFTQYWIQAIHHLAHNKLVTSGEGVRLSTNREEYFTGDSIRVSLRFPLFSQVENSETFDVVLQGRDGLRRPLHLQTERIGSHTLSTTLNALPPGNYDIVYNDSPGESLKVSFRVIQESIELKERLPDFKEMEALAKGTGGISFHGLEANEIGEQLPEVLPVERESLAPLPIWSIWPTLGLTLGLFIAEWVTRSWLRGS